jgi:hypothetical protein
MVSGLRQQSQMTNVSLGRRVDADRQLGSVRFGFGLWPLLRKGTVCLAVVQLLERLTAEFADCYGCFALRRRRLCKWCIVDSLQAGGVEDGFDYFVGR